MLQSRADVGMIVATVLAAGTACGNTVKGTEQPWGPLSTTATPHLPSGSRASINHTLDVFVRNGVERRDPARAYAVASSMMRIGQTRTQWNQGTLPVPPYRTKGTEFHGYTVMSASRKQVYLGHTGYRVPAGHRLRLQVASSDYPLYVAHPGTSESPWFATRTAVNHQRLVTGGATPSYLSVTVLDE